MSQLLIEHAKRHVWQEPDQDHQYHIGLGRLTRNGGFLTSMQVGWHRVLSPTRSDGKKRYYHVYQIGQLADITLNLVKQLTEDKWYKAEEIVNKHNVFIQVYMLTGATVPLPFIWLMRDFTNNLLVCVEHEKIVDYGDAQGYIDPVDQIHSPYRITLDNTDLVIRFYSNAVQNKLDWHAQSGVPSDTVEALSDVPYNQTEYNALIVRMNTMRNKYIVKGTNAPRGQLLTFVDGFLKTVVPSYTNDIKGKRLSFIYDESIVHTQQFKLKHLPVFKSKLDLNQTKYLVLLNSEYNTIIHHDDVDFYLVNTVEDKGLYLSRVHQDHVRQVVHNGYAVDTQTIRSYINLYDWTDMIDHLSLHVIVRRGGMQNMPFSQSNRIDELFRLPYLTIYNTFLNTDSLLDEWKAGVLERSDYIKLLTSHGDKVTDTLVTEAYGYPGIVQSLLSPILERDGTSDRWKIPEGITWDNPYKSTIHRTIYGYDAEGMLVGSYTEEGKVNVTRIPSNFPNHAKVTNLEMFRLKRCAASELSGLTVNNDVQSHDLINYGFACYVAVDGSNQWRDITGSSYYKFLTAKENNGVPKIAWNWSLLTTANVIPCVRINSHVLNYTVVLTRDAKYPGYYAVVTQGSHLRGTSKITGDYNFPVGKLDVFANGYCLIEGIDYYADFPNIVINNQLINQLDKVEITVRCYGLADKSTGKHYPPVEVGFIRGGWLSADGQYQIARNRPNFVVMNSRRQWNHRTGDYAAWMEYHDKTETEAKHRLQDGRPYMIQDYIVPVDHVATETTNVLYKRMVDTDVRLSKYLNQLLPEKSVTNPRAITNRWQLVSPVISALLHNMRLGAMKDSSFIPGFSISDVGVWMRSYEWLLPYDPAYHNIDSSYTYILPHPYTVPMTCTLNQYQFLEVVISLYLNDRIDLSKHVQVRSS